MKNPQTRVQQGFTIVELLTGLLSSGTALIVGGVGLISVLSYSQGSTNEIEAQQDGIRALEFISTEARQANLFIRDPAQSAEFTAQSGAISGAITPVIGMEIDALPEPVVYFLADAIDPWEGTGLYRWGPAFDPDGEYINEDTPGNWEHALLVDKVSNTPNAIDCNEWPSSSSTATNTGFYACVDNTGKIAEFILNSDGTEQSIRAKTFARSTLLPSDP